jgi:hypothetical protein
MPQSAISERDTLQEQNDRIRDLLLTVRSLG